MLTNLGEDDRPNAEQMALLDARLDAPEGRTVQSWVGNLPEEEPSLAWRSALNERLREMKPKPGLRRRLLYPGFGLAAAAALAVVFWTAQLSNDEPPAIGPTLEAALVSTHRDSVRAAELAGAGMAPHDLATLHKSSPEEPQFEWNELDVETL